MSTDQKAPARRLTWWALLALDLKKARAAETKLRLEQPPIDDYVDRLKRARLERDLVCLTAQIAELERHGNA